MVFMWTSLMTAKAAMCPGAPWAENTHAPGTGTGRKRRSLDGQTRHTLAVLVCESKWEPLLFCFLGPQAVAV